MLTKILGEAHTILQNDSVTVKIFDVNYKQTFKMIWLGIHKKELNQQTIDEVCYVFKAALEYSSTRVCIHLEHLTDGNVDVPSLELMQRIAATLITNTKIIKGKVLATIFQPSVLDTLTKTAFKTLNMMYTHKGPMMISDNVAEIEKFAQSITEDTY